MSTQNDQPTAGRQGQAAARSDAPAGRESEDVAPAEAGAENKNALPAFTPVPRAKERSNGWSPDVQRAFIEALAETGSVRAACRRVRRADHGAYLLRRHPEAESFRKAWAAALDIGMQRVEDVAMERALNGVEVPVYSYGKLVGSGTVYNDRLLMFMLRNRAPERFGGSAAGSEGQRRAKGMDAIGKMELERLKKQWREDWEAERAATGADSDDEDAVIAGINAKLSAMRTRRLALMSPRTRAALEEYERLKALDAAEGYECWTDPEHPLYTDGDPDRREGEEGDEPTALPPPGWGEREAEDEREEEGPRWRTVKDEGWG